VTASKHSVEWLLLASHASEQTLGPKSHSGLLTVPLLFIRAAAIQHHTSLRDEQLISTPKPFTSYFSAHGSMASPFSKPSTQTVPHSDAKPIPSTSHPTAHQTMAEQQHESHEHINADLYRTFSPSDVAMWDWKAGKYGFK
jgi:hypothetical protein